MSALLDLLGSTFPIIQGPIGMLNNPKMVAAVSDAGAYGMLSLGFAKDPGEVKAMADEIRTITDKPFGANIMLNNPNNEHILKALAEAGVKTVTTSVGNPSKVYPIIHDLGMKGLHVTLALAHALRAVKSGVDGVVMSGSESGGLRSTGFELSNMVLVPLVADHIDLPIVAAGGIADRRSYRAALALGAQGVQLGTRLIATDESPASPFWKESIVNSGDGDTALFPMENMRVRGVITDEFRRRIDEEGINNMQLSFNNLGEAWYGNNFASAPPGAGEVSALINEIKPVKDIIEEMIS